MMFNKIGLGTVQFGSDYGISNHNGQTPLSEVSKILDYAKNCNIKILDTATAYGKSELILGQFDLSSFKVVTKFIGNNNSTIIDEFDKSLSKLKLNCIYGFLSHRPKEIINNPKLWDTLKELKIQKKVEKIGFSFNSPIEIDQILAMEIIPDLVQVPYNYFDQRYKEKLIYLKSLGCEVHTRSVFLQGLFFEEINVLPPFFNPIKNIIQDIQNLSYDKIAGSLINSVSKNSFIDKIIIGVNTLSQLTANLSSISESTDLPKLLHQIPEKIIDPNQWPKIK
jgi:aryl-alcohol dehydrogenase-like predicted oxidoreductase